MRITFDTNTLDRAVRPERFPKDPRQAEYVTVHDALALGAIKGFFCATLVMIEGIQRNDRAAVLATTSLRIKILPETTTLDGIPAIPINLHVEQRRPPLHPEMAARVGAALGLGLRVLGVPRVGLPRIEDRDGAIYVSEPDTLALSERLDRYFDVATAIECRGSGIRQAQALAEKFAKRDNATEHWFHSLIRARDVHEENAVKRACSEWADGDSVAAHIGYNNDLFCTEDAGMSAGGNSIFNETNRAWLEQTYGTKFVTLAELAAQV